MTCLTSTQIQAVADGEAADDLRAHVGTCERCAQRVSDRKRTTASLITSLNTDARMPQDLSRRIATALAAAPSSGATRLRSPTDRGRPRRRAFWSGALAAAAAALAFLFIGQLIKEPGTVSASAILAESATRLDTAATSGVELLEYELVLDGMPRELMPDQANGTYRVKQAIDHDTAGRFCFTSYDPSGQLISSIAQDPRIGRRVIVLRFDGQPYRFDFTLPPNAALSIPEVERVHMQASVRMMQASGNQQLQVVETPDGTAYRIEVPKVSGATTTAVWDLTEARALIDADDYRVLELSVKGAFLKQPYSVFFRAISRDVMSQADVPADKFEVPDTPGAIAFEGEGTAMPARDAMVAALRALARLKQTR